MDISIRNKSKFLYLSNVYCHLCICLKYDTCKELLVWHVPYITLKDAVLKCVEHI